MVYLYNILLHSNKNEHTTAALSIDKSQKYNSEQKKKPDTSEHICHSTDIKSGKIKLRLSGMHD